MNHQPDPRPPRLAAHQNDSFCRYHVKDPVGLGVFGNTLGMIHRSSSVEILSSSSFEGRFIGVPAFHTSTHATLCHSEMAKVESQLNLMFALSRMVHFYVSEK